MSEERARRIARQHVQTDLLLGIEAVPAHRDRPTADTPAPPSTMPAVTGDKLAQLRVIDEGEVRGCTRCALCESRTQTVFGEGNPEAALMFIGEGPGQTEDEMGRPFVGRSGELLDKMIGAMGMKRQDVYIANVVKCRPPNNRTPTPEESATCWTYLERQIAIIQPRVIVTLGNPATKAILETTTGIMKLRGTWQACQRVPGLAIPVMPTFHPSFVLRQYTQENRQKVWSDLQQVMAKLAAG